LGIVPNSKLPADAVALSQEEEKIWVDSLQVRGMGVVAGEGYECGVGVVVREGYGCGVGVVVGEGYGCGVGVVAGEGCGCGPCANKCGK